MPKTVTNRAGPRGGADAPARSRSVPAFEQTALRRDPGEIENRFRVELVQDPDAVGLDCPRARPEPLADLGARQPLHDEVEHLALARGQDSDGIASGPLAARVHLAAGKARRQVGSTAADGLDGVREMLERFVLRRVSGGSSIESLRDAVRILDHADDEDAQIGLAAA